MNNIVTFPQMGNYYIPINYLLKNILNLKIQEPSKITDKTIEIGTKYSPDFVCMPFKYTLGTFIEGLENGANILIQAGGGCRYGYYSELQINILKDLGYDFTYINLVSEGKADLKKIYKKFKNIDPKFNVFNAIYYLIITKYMIKYMDEIENYIRKNIGFEIEENSFINLNKEMLEKFSKVKSLAHLKILYRIYLIKFKKIKINKPKNCLKVGIIGELYTVMEPAANYDLEKTLASFNIEIKRYTNAHYLLFEKAKKIKEYLKYSKEYNKYKMGADAADNIARTKYMCKKNYDGIIHIKSTFCTPEIGAMPIINKIGNKSNIPVLFFSFDANTSKIGIETRIEAFYDMIERKKNEKLLFRN
ncbi:MAG: 2-hydroxyacyl-CoA dehydratase [Bacilli bacterium]